MASGIDPDPKIAPPKPAVGSTAKSTAAPKAASPKAAVPPAPKTAAKNTAVPVAKEQNAHPQQRREASGFLTVLSAAPAWAVSMLVHIVILLSLSLISNDFPKTEEKRVITSSAPEVQEEFEEFEEIDQDQPEVGEITDAVVVPDASMVEDVQIVSTADDLDAAALSVELTDFSTESAPSSDLLSTVGAIGGQAGGLGGRTGAQRSKLLQAGGGNAQSEAAVEAALKWFINHQLPDGGWSFDMNQCPSCKGACTHSGNPGTSLDRCGATSLALLPFLGRGYTHKEGPYKKQVEAGIGFLAAMSMQGQGKVYGPGGNMYSQGLAGIALSESYAMTKDKRLQVPAQLALNFIVNAQDPIGGGWRYSPRQAGDTSAVGWQLMALKSGHMAYLQVPPITVKKAVEFLNSMQADDGAAYGYDNPGNAPGTTAVGLLCRMYLGWKKDHPALQRGVDRLAKSGPSKDLYTSYYSTQILHHVEGDRWVSWNTKMRDMLVTTQSKAAHEAGSWYDGVETGHGAHVAGRLYCTSLATMILEVYYRHLPIYGASSIDDFKE